MTSTRCTEEAPVEESRRMMDALLEAPPRLRGCPAGSWGQAAVHELVPGDGRYRPLVSG